MSAPSPAKAFRVRFYRSQMFEVTVLAEDAENAIAKVEDHWVGQGGVPETDILDECSYGTDPFEDPSAEEVEP